MVGGEDGKRGANRKRVRSKRGARMVERGKGQGKVEEWLGN